LIPSSPSRPDLYRLRLLKDKRESCSAFIWCVPKRPDGVTAAAVFAYNTQSTRRVALMATEFIMEIIPAIDLRHGACVRLFQGDYSREEVFDLDPSSVARRWHSYGARLIHVVDLDGAAGGRLMNLESIEAMVSIDEVKLEVGGGIRTRETADELFDLGVERVVLGTAAIEDPELVGTLSASYPGAIVVSLDARDGLVTTRGWLVATTVPVADLCERMVAAGVSRFVYTDVRRDGTMTEPNFDALEQLVRSTSARVVAAGGITSLEHLRRLRDVGAAGAILGKAIYVGSIDLGEALSLYGG
jgi:phosphoribosylformimino-5-aminoimidazole carboxamide ribotide isomerase